MSTKERKGEGCGKGYHKGSGTIGGLGGGNKTVGKEGRKKGRKEGRKEGPTLLPVSPYSPDRPPTSCYPYTVALCPNPHPPDNRRLRLTTAPPRLDPLRDENAHNSIVEGLFSLCPPHVLFFYRLSSKLFLSYIVRHDGVIARHRASQPARLDKKEIKFQSIALKTR